ncbi:efflux transporter outer membrane subunit [Caenimonas aquaedulcis]|uniref:Efflux transporter outer membrane subunit n=1 Tax=Caenimonas aquaedulcis TaxID=2793270 RepID=A0A931H5B3_9BURK|nr:efflux transporter outer membrane subunit [Caenimonas aquaedulcis]MBG9388856.1 efflux transporter outer membrane subunit [Caenimonas aquaedulcis]
MKKLVFLAAAAVLAAGCSTPRPPASAGTQAPPQWYAPLPHAGELADLRAWWAQWDDPLLIQLIESAQSASPTLATAASRIRQARATRVAAGAALLPTLDAVASAQRGDTQPPVPLASVAQAGLQTAWEIDLFGANRDAADAAQARLEGAGAGWHAARVAVAAETATSYVSLRTCEELRAVTLNDAKSRAETARLSGLSERAGFTAPATASLARASAAEASARATQQAAQCDIEVKGLVALTAMPEPVLRERLAAGWTEPVTPGLLTVVSVPAQLLAQRPDVRQAELEVAAASAEVGSARAQRFPRVSLTGSINAGVVRTGGVTSDLQTWSIGPLALTLPLFDGGRRSANVDSAQARYEEAVLLYRARVRQAVREVEEALVNLQSARSRTEDALAAREGYRASFTATEALYNSGLASLVQLEDSRRTALAAETAWVQLRRERVTAWIALYRAMGGGWAAQEMATR